MTFKIFKRLDFNTTYDITIRTKLGDITGDWLDPPLEVTTYTRDTIFPVTNVSLDFDKKGGGKFPYRAIPRWSELVLANCNDPDRVDHYSVQLWRWDPLTQSLMDDQPFRHKTVMGKDDDPNTVDKAIFAHIPKRYWYVARVRGIVNHNRGIWSQFSLPGSPSDLFPPPTPQNVVIRRAPHGVKLHWVVPTEWIVMTGTVSVVSGSNAVTGTDTHFTAEVGAGEELRVGNEIHVIDSVFSDTYLTTEDNWSVTYNDVYYSSDITTDDISHAKTQVATTGNFKHIAERNPYVWVNHDTLRVEDSDSSYWGRVCLVDSSGLRSRWVEGTHDGNSDPDVNGDAVKPKNIETNPTFTVSGDLKIKEYHHRWLAHHDYRIKAVSATLGTLPSGDQVKVQIYKNGENILRPADRLTIGPQNDNHMARTGQIRASMDTLDEGDHLRISVDSIGTGSPGADLVVQVRLERVDDVQPSTLQDDGSGSAGGGSTGVTDPPTGGSGGSRKVTVNALVGDGSTTTGGGNNTLLQVGVFTKVDTSNAHTIGGTSDAAMTDLEKKVWGTNPNGTPQKRYQWHRIYYTQWDNNDSSVVNTLTHGRKPWISVKPPTGSTWADVANGNLSGRRTFQQWVNTINSWDTEGIFTFNHEPFDDAGRGTAADFVAATRRIYSEFKSRGLDSRWKIIPIFTAFDYDAGRMSTWWPGNNYADGAGVDGYCRFPCVDNNWRSWQQVVSPTVDFAYTNNKLVYVGEFGTEEKDSWDELLQHYECQSLAESKLGFALAANGDNNALNLKQSKGAWFDDVTTVVLTTPPSVKWQNRFAVMCYFNSNHDYDFWVDTRAYSLQHYKNFVNQCLNSQ